MVQVRGMEIDTARLKGITVRAAGVDLAGLSGAALHELHRCFASTARRYRHALFSGAKRRICRGVEQIARQLAMEAERRARPEPKPSAASLTLIFESVQDAAYLGAFLEGLKQMYLSERAKIARQGELERSICDVKGVGYECAKFCSSVVGAIVETEVET